MEALRIVAIVLGTTGFWKLMEMFLERKKYKAEVNHLNTQINSQIITNWVSWSTKLEERVNELEGRNKEMQKTIARQKEKITGLENQVSQLKEQLRTYQQHGE
jgi:predicted RNase H-like nuclease (RuvC/YqgF family)